MYEINENEFDNEIKSKDYKNSVFNLDLEGFNGPLDLLLQLAQTK